jgi:hypothetical protein
MVNSPCPKGMILRSAYIRKNGTFVKATCVPDKGKKGKTPISKKVLPIPIPGNLGKYGYYNIKKTLAKYRREALKKGVIAEGYATIIRRLNLLANYNKNSNPELYTKMKSDIKWIQENLYDYSLASKKAAEKKVSKKSAEKKVSKKAAEKKASKKAAEKKASKKATEKKVSKKAAEKKVSKKSAEKKVSKKQVKNLKEYDDEIPLIRKPKKFKKG